MPGWYGHDITVNIEKSGVNTKIDLAPPCDGLAQEVNSEIGDMIGKLEGGLGGLVGEVAQVSRESQISSLSGYGSNKSGTLAGSITIESSGESARVGTDLFYAEYVNDGRGSVTAQDGVLHFFNDGEEVFVKSVGPAAPRPYIDDSSNMLEVQIDSIISKYMGSI